MKLEVHFEAVYDKWRQHECPPGHQNEVVVKRASFTADITKSLEANCVAEGERVFAAAKVVPASYNHRIVVTSFWIDEVRAEPAQWIKVPVKITQSV